MSTILNVISMYFTCTYTVMYMSTSIMMKPLQLCADEVVVPSFEKSVKSISTY